jgi:hypothetical protein
VPGLNGYYLSSSLFTTIKNKLQNMKISYSLFPNRDEFYKYYKSPKNAPASADEDQLHIPVLMD